MYRSDCNSPVALADVIPPQCGDFIPQPTSSRNAAPRPRPDRSRPENTATKRRFFRAHFEGSSHAREPVRTAHTQGRGALRLHTHTQGPIRQPSLRLEVDSPLQRHY